MRFESRTKTGVVAVLGWIASYLHCACSKARLPMTASADWIRLCFGSEKGVCRCMLLFSSTLCQTCHPWYCEAEGKAYVTGGQYVRLVRREHVLKRILTVVHGKDRPSGSKRVRKYPIPQHKTSDGPGCESRVCLVC